MQNNPKCYVVLLIGDTLTIVAKVNNSSSSEMTPKFSLIREVVYRAEGNVKHENSVIQKVSEHCIKPKTQREVKCDLRIPRDLTQTIHNCDLISVQYHLKVCNNEEVIINHSLFTKLLLN